jgi:hypothetical protein
MRELTAEIERELEQLAPLDESHTADWRNALHRAGETKHVTRRFVLGVAVVLVAVAAPTIALSSSVRGLLGFSQPVLAKSQVLVSAPVGNGYFAHLLSGPSTTGGQCQFMTFDHHASLVRPIAPHSFGGGGGCSVSSGTAFAEPTKAQPMFTEFSIERRLKEGKPANWVPPVVSGIVWAGLHVTRVAVVWHGGSHALVLKNDRFIGGTPALYLPPFAEFPFAIVAYDHSGKEVARKKLDSPSLLMLRHGWKEYARLYHAWQKAHHR